MEFEENLPVVEEEILRCVSGRIFRNTLSHGGINVYHDFLAVILFGSSPPLAPPPPHSRQQVVSLSQTSCVSPVKFTAKRRGGEGEPSNTTARMPGTEYSRVHHRTMKLHGGRRQYTEM